MGEIGAMKAYQLLALSMPLEEVNARRTQKTGDFG